MKRKGSLIVLSGFSGAGKGTIVKELIKQYGYQVSISATTRSPREGEVHGKDYYFKSKEEFEAMIEENGFIEWAKYVGNYYGTPRAFVEEALNQGKNVILEIEVQGAMNIKEQYPDAILMFIAPPSAEILRERLIGRGTEDMETIEKRLNRAKEEVNDMEQYDYLVINDKLDECVEEIHQIVLKESCRMKGQTDFIHTMKQELQNL
ncbi:MAG: guanylate kinase [Firmicutes bacterium]|uniref:Guanylate kinase n=1 Tax=Candidatus Scybalomonas excrementavium TaxID=2840943 RepID=A0A9D9HZ90_9FIRM|nr:guanylate kinase [Candidatus Scybalomonas excrementavium]